MDFRPWPDAVAAGRNYRRWRVRCRLEALVLAAAEMANSAALTRNTDRQGRTCHGDEIRTGGGGQNTTRLPKPLG